MRDHWDAGSRAVLDEPATITERQLRSLRRGARAGRFAILLALVSVGAAGWSLLMGPDAFAGLEGIQDVRQRFLSAIGRPIPAQSFQARAYQAYQSESLRPPDGSGGPDSMRAAASPTLPPPERAETRTAQRGVSSGR